MVTNKFKTGLLLIILFLSSLIICNNLLNGLTIKFRSNINQDVQIFEGVDYRDYTEDYSWRFIVKEGINDYQIPLKGIRIQKVRIDLSVGNSILVESISSKNFFGVSDCSLDPEYIYDVIVDRFEGGLKISSAADAKDPYVSIRCKNTFQKYIILESAIYWLVIFCLQAFLLLLLSRLYKRLNEKNIFPIFQLISNKCINNPLKAIVITVLIGVIISHNQVIFFKKSNVAPLGTSLIYSGTPSLPNYSFERIYDYHGSDTGAMMWQHIAYTYQAGEAINNYGEIPLWNRFNGVGRSLIGQGQAMIAEPLNLLIAVTGFTAEKYDFKYILLKAIFSLSLALIVYLLTSHVGAACAIGFLSTFISFYLFRLNHPAYFTMAYGPLILLAYAYAARGISKFELVTFSLAIFVGNWMVLTSGTGKEAFLSIIFYNAIGFLWLVSTPLKKSIYATWFATNFLFAIISSPLWMTFLSYVVVEKSGYAEPHADQYLPSQLIYFGENLGFLATGGYQPALNFPLFYLFILGIIFLFSSKEFRSGKTLIVGLSALALLFCSYGLVPKWLFLVTPFINSVHHITDVFSSIAIAPAIILAGYAITFLFSDLDKFVKTKPYLIAIVLFLLLASYFGPQDILNQKQILFTIYCLLSLYIFITAINTIQNSKVGVIKLGNLLYLSAFLLLLIFRGVQWPNTSLALKDYVFIPSPRANLKPDFDLVKNWHEINQSNPTRAIGTDGTMFSGYRSIYGIESIDGPDALFPKYYRKLSESLQMPYGWYWRMEFNNEKILKGIPALAFLNVGYVFSEHSLKGLGTPLKAIDGINLYGLEGVWPRAFFIDCAEVVSSELILDKINSKIKTAAPFLLLEASGVSSPNPNPNECSTPMVVPASNYQLTANKTKFEVNAPRSGFIYLSENYEENNFIARINGNEKEIQRGNYAFKAIKVENPGTYQVEIEYAPKNFYELLQVAKMGIVSYLLLLMGMIGFLMTKLLGKYRK